MSSRKNLTEYRRKRDFRITGEPAGEVDKPSATRVKRVHAAPERTLEFVIQKHAASHLHYDLRLEMGGTMKSWAVPKGPSLDPAMKRLAMEVEDHPIEYNKFEGSIPKGQYGGGTVMIWDRGTYTADNSEGSGHEATLLRGHEAGELKFTLSGERLRGSYVLVRMKRPGKPQWLLLKHRDDHANSDSDITESETTSITTGRTMDEIAEGKPSRKQKRRPSTRTSRGGPPPQDKSEAVDVQRPHQINTAASVPSLAPMLASVASTVPSDSGWTFEPKYDGIRVLAVGSLTQIQLLSRNGNDKARQFPEIVQAIRKLVAQHGSPLILDGEIVALSSEGEVVRFQVLQQRMHVTDASSIATHSENSPAALMAFDLLLDGEEALPNLPWSDRRKRLASTLRKRTSSQIRLSESVPNDGNVMLERARAAGWEGVIAKRMDSPYVFGARSRHWVKLKVEFRQEFVVGGYTEPRNSREHLGALLLGYFSGDRFIYAGHAGGGFTRAGLKDMRRRLDALSVTAAPFEQAPRTNEKAHWVRPEIVVEIKFNEWTTDGKLRQPVFLGIRDDKSAREVGRERQSVQVEERTKGKKRKAPSSEPVADSSALLLVPENVAGEIGRKRGRSTVRRSKPASGAASSVTSQLEQIEGGRGDGIVKITEEQQVKVTSLGKVYFPKPRHTKGEVLRYYAEMAKYILPVIADRPLVLRRFPEGIDGTPFFQQKPPKEAPPGVRVESIDTDEGAQPRIVGGDLETLLYLAQIGCISMDPWQSRVQSIDAADYTILDLDPGPGADFRQVVEVALAVQEELGALQITGVPKTSGSRGIHVVLPLPTGSGYDTALILAQLVATQVAGTHPKIATVERRVDRRPVGTVYVDYLQNIRGKSVACAYSVRAKPGALVSAPLEWSEITPSLDLRDFTIATMPSRVAQSGDLWSPAMKKRNSLRAIGLGSKK
ncbi:MAG: DNA ligase D [Gemmatimonadaceae bacterium]|nr:DNA ligase D [Gemmatimonadaceae bacterium]